ncbi:MAG TPA: hypothetical protein VGL22_03005 [Terracidiphilus sp.]
MSTPTPESAVQRCLDAYLKACAHDDARNDYSPESLRRTRRVWREAMPFLTPDPDAIDAFIACVTHGMILEVFTPAETSKLLYAAQTAIGSRRARTEALRAQSKSQQPTPTPSPSAEIPAPLPLCTSVPAPPPTPLPPLRMEAAKPQLAPPQVAQVAQVVAAPRKPSTTPPLMNQKEIDRLVEQLYSGILPGKSCNAPPPSLL